MYLRLLQKGLIVCAILFSSPVFAQSAAPVIPNPARVDDTKSILSLANAYNAAPGSLDIYNEYLSALLAAKNYKEAENLINTQQRYTNSPIMVIDLGRTYAAAGKEKKAIEQYDRALAAINGDELTTSQLARTFSEIGRDDYAVKAYEQHRNLLRNSYVFSSPLSRLYAKTGMIDKAIETLIEGAPFQQGGVEDAKASMLEMLGNDPRKLQTAQKTLIKHINAQPEDVFYAELLTWLYTQKGDWDGALMQIIAIDERNKEAGNRLLNFANFALSQKQYDIALKSLDAVIEKGKDAPLYPPARMGRLAVGLQQLQETPKFTQEQVTKLSRDYDSFFVAFPDYRIRDIVNDAAMLEAQYNNNPKKAIDLLKTGISLAGGSREFIGRSKLQLGDYQILVGQIWEATLTYGQVDKDFREDMLGEEARFRSAKLAYYRGDFEWAQDQLSVLKASTSELISNDALSLSVLITENTPDSSFAPLKAYARADLLLFQNKTDDALRLLDSIATAFPKHTLNDDLLMSRAAIAMKRRDYTAALSYLHEVVEKYGKDVLADDALFKTADIYERYLQKPEDARKYYEELIIDYPGSTYVQTARQRLEKLAATGVGT